jgi:hypothetical protein
MRERFLRRLQVFEQLLHERVVDLADYLVNNLTAIRAALEAAGVEFTNGKRPGVRLKAKRSNDRGR